MGGFVAELPCTRRPDGLLGRSDDVLCVARALGVSRLVTLTGAPGIGKTRLALAVGVEHEDPATVVDLASIADPSLIAATLASALSVQEAPGYSLAEAIVASLRRRRLLLVLDNCEHLLGACAQITAQLLDQCQGVRVLATSREPLDADGELVWRVPPLAVPGREDETDLEAVLACSAIALFVERAAAVQPGFTLNAFVAGDVTNICRRLDGLPLAVELAAARAGTMTPGEIARYLDAHIGLLGEDSRGSAPRHRTLAAALEWSHALLTEPEREVLRCLSVFSGTFELEAASAVCAREASTTRETSELIDRLVSRSLVVCDADPDRPGRYRLLETVRAYAAEKLEQACEVADRRTAHAAFYLGLAERAERQFTGPHQQDWFDRIAAERANLHSAIEWSLAQRKGDWALRMTGSLVLFWRVRGLYSEGRDLLQASLSVGTHAAPEMRAKALWGAGFLGHMAGATDTAIPLLKQSLASYRELGDAKGSARALLILANARAEGDPGRNTELLGQSINLARSAGDSWCLAHALGLAGFFEKEWYEDSDHARAMFEECLDVARDAGDLQGLRFGLIGLGQCAIGQADYGRAESLLWEAVDVTHKLGEDYSRAEAIRSLGEIALRRGVCARATELAHTALDLIGEIAPPDARLHILSLLAGVAEAEGDYERARAVFEEITSQTRSCSIVLALGRLALHEDDFASARTLLEEAVTLARGEGADRIRARALYELAVLARRQDDPASARALLETALAIQRKARHLPAIASTLEAVGGLAASAGELEQATRLFGAARTVRKEGGYGVPTLQYERFKSDLAILQGTMSPETYMQALADGEALPLDRALTEAFGHLRPTSSPRARARLTDRELEVAELAADGMSNDEIAERLVLAHNTVRSHLTRIYAKLGVTGRNVLASALSAYPTAGQSTALPLAEVAPNLHGEADAYRFLEELRWPDGSPACPHCESVRKHYFLAPKGGTGRKTGAGSVSHRRIWKCADCRKLFSVLTGTILHGSKIPVRTWVLVVAEMTGSGTGISAREIELKFGLTPKTASFMVHRVRDALNHEPLRGLLSRTIVRGQVERGRS